MALIPSVSELVVALRAFGGYRTLWLDEQGVLVHAEPEEELEAEGYRYIATLMHPSPEALAEALGRAGVPLTPAPAADESAPGWVAAVPQSA